MQLFLVAISHTPYFRAYNVLITPTGTVQIMENNCQNFYFLSTLACQLTECLDKKKLKMLSTDLTTLGYMIES